MPRSPSRVVVAPAPFKGALSASRAADALARGLRRAGVEPVCVPVADGGEGTLDALVGAAGGEVRRVPAHDPLGRTIEAPLGLLSDGTAVVELAAASGYERLTAAERDPERTSTYGTGELIRAALDAGATRILVGVGGSATCDGGLGLLRALGARLVDASGAELSGTGADLAQLARLDISGLDPRIAGTPVDVACDVDNPLTGPTGAARVFGPQKGASPEAVARLDAGLGRLAALIARPDLTAMPCAGAAGGAAAGMHAILGARLLPGAQVVLDAVRLTEQLPGAVACITGEGALDAQTGAGKAPAAVAAACRLAGVPCIAVAGRLDLDPGALAALGFAAAFPINREVVPIELALARTGENLTAAGAAIGSLLGGS